MALPNRFAAATALAAALSFAATPVAAHGYYHHWHHDHIDGGDVLAGLAIFGGIAAIASAASHAHHDAPPAAPPPVPDDRQGYSQGAAPQDESLDRTADLCVGAVERGQSRVDYVDNVSRDQQGWAVSGALQGGAPFSCHIGDDGRVLGVNIGQPGAAPTPYTGGPAAPPTPNSYAPPPVDNRPVWHGDEASAQPQDDGRYQASDTPDFGQRT